MRRLEEVGPDTLEIDLKKELKRWVIVMHVFQSFLMMMGLPWKDINLENLDKKMNILDKLTKDDLRKFMVDLRPELLDDTADSNENEEDKKMSKMKVRLSRKNPEDKIDKYDSLMRQTAVVIRDIMKKSDVASLPDKSPEKFSAPCRAVSARLSQTIKHHHWSKLQSS